MLCQITGRDVTETRVKEYLTLPSRPQRYAYNAPMADFTSSTTKDDIDFEDVASELEDRQSSPPTYEIATYPADFTLEVLESKWRSGEIFIPPFQRGYVWNQTQASKLIESFLVGLPVPAIFLYTESGTERSMIVDGQQRLKTIFYFFEGFFGEANPRGMRPIFTLKGLSEDSPYFNKSFADLEEDQASAARRLKNSVLRAFMIRQLNPNDDTSVFHVFERLNTGGTLLHNQEVRNAICTGPFNEMLHDCNAYSAWRTILGKPKPDSRMRDIELILRFFSLRHASDQYEKPMKDFMSKYMSAHRNDSDETISNFEREFKDTVDTIVEHLGSKPFHLYSGFNSSVFDSVAVAISKHIDHIPSDFTDRWKRLASSEQLRVSVTGGTTDVDQVRSRMKLAEDTLFQ